MFNKCLSVNECYVGCALNLPLTFLRLAKVAIFSTKLHAENQCLINHKTVCGARHRHFCQTHVIGRFSSHVVHMFQVMQLSIPPLSATSLLSIVAICCPLKSCSNCLTAISSSLIPKVGIITVFCICKKLM